MILNQAAINLYRTTVDTILKKYSENILSNVEDMTWAAIEHYLDGSDDTNIYSQNIFFDKVAEVFYNKISITTEAKTSICQGLRSFTSDSGCEGILGGDSSIDDSLSGEETSECSKNHNPFLLRDC